MRSQLPSGRRESNAGQRLCTGRGFTLVETLLALAISAMLLAAVATAFNASVINYNENERMYDTLNNARQALLRMTAQLRTGHLVDPAATTVRCSFFTSDDEDITYEYRTGAHQLVLITNDDGHEYVLCNNVTALTFTKVPTDNGADCKSVRISLTVRSGNRSQTLSSAAVIRRNLTS
jgi:prepilin-type N-terminal cleavage/methylation domain-containing protein